MATCQHHRIDLYRFLSMAPEWADGDHILCELSAGGKPKEMMTESLLPPKSHVII